MTEQRKTNVLWWAIPAAAVLLLALLSMFGGVSPPRAPPRQSTYDATDRGVRATYLLLEGLDYKVAQSRRLSAGRLRWVLFPATKQETSEESRTGERGSVRNEADGLDRWVREGGTLLLAAESAEFAGMLGLRVQSDSASSAAVRLYDPQRTLTIAPGFARVTPLDRADRRWPETGEALASIFRRGRGEIWIVHRPEIFRNERLRESDNARAICRLADVTSREQSERIYFDEYFHGMRERPGPLQLLFEPPVLWVTLQGLGVLAVLLWRFLPRFGPLRDAPPPRRRSKEEFLDAMAFLLARKEAYAEALAIVRDAFAREIERELGLPASTPIEELTEHACRRRPGLDREALIHALSRRAPPSDPDEFIRAINELESLRREYLHE